MEEFSDLSLYLHPKPNSQNTIEELNTPTFGKKTESFLEIILNGLIIHFVSDKSLAEYDLNFDFSQTGQHFIKLESKLYDNIISNNMFKNNSIDIMKMNKNEYMTSEFDTIQLQNSISNVVSPGSDNGSVYDHLNFHSYNVSGTSYGRDHQSALSVNSKSENISSNDSSPATDIQQLPSGTTTPESSNCPTPKLSLNVNLRPTQNFDLTTPSIIEDVVELESVNFNILEYMQSEVSRWIIRGAVIFICIHLEGFSS